MEQRLSRSVTLGKGSTAATKRARVPLSKNLYAVWIRYLIVDPTNESGFIVERHVDSTPSALNSSVQSRASV